MSEIEPIVTALRSLKGLHVREQELEALHLAIIGMKVATREFDDEHLTAPLERLYLRLFEELVAKPMYEGVGGTQTDTLKEFISLAAAAAELVLFETFEIKKKGQARTAVLEVCSDDVTRATLRDWASDKRRLTQERVRKRDMIAAGIRLRSRSEQDVLDWLRGVFVRAENLKDYAPYAQPRVCGEMKMGTRVIVTFANLDPSLGKVIGGSENDLTKVLHDNGQENWHPEERVSTLLRSVPS